MGKSLVKLALYLDEHRPDCRQPGRKSSHCIPDMLDRGEHLVFNTQLLTRTVDDDRVDQAVEEEDLAVEFWL